MLSKAIEKLQSEMTKNKTNPMIQVVGGFLLKHLENNPLDAEKIIIEDKTIGKSLDEMRKRSFEKKGWELRCAYGSGRVFYRA